MTAYTFRILRNGVERLDWIAEDLDQASQRLSQGTYTTLRTFEGRKFLRLDAHLDRLERSAALLGYPIHLDRPRLRNALAQVLERYRFPEARVRITVGLENDLPLPQPEVYVTVEPFRPPDEELYRRGVRVITMLITRADPRAKSTRFIVPSRTLKAGLPQEVYEVLMITGDGKILEGFTSNFFAVLEGRLVTAGEGVLEGITRGMVLELAPEVLPVELRAPRLREIPAFQEAFITSSSRGIVPVVVINEQVIGDGRPGPITAELRRRYEAQVRREAAPPE